MAITTRITQRDFFPKEEVFFTCEVTFPASHPNGAVVRTFSSDDPQKNGQSLIGLMKFQSANDLNVKARLEFIKKQPISWREVNVCTLSHEGPLEEVLATLKTALDQNH